MFTWPTSRRPKLRCPTDPTGTALFDTEASGYPHVSLSLYPLYLLVYSELISKPCRFRYGKHAADSEFFEGKMLDTAHLPPDKRTGYLNWIQGNANVVRNALVRRCATERYRHMKACTKNMPQHVVPVDDAFV